MFSQTRNAIEPLPGLYTVTGRLWIVTAPSVKMYLKVYQRVTLHTEVQNDAVCGDSTRLEQILLNLMSNTVKCTGKGEHITLSAEQKLSSQGGVSCMKFITEEFQRRLFLPFERTDDSRVTQVQSTEGTCRHADDEWRHPGVEPHRPGLVQQFPPNFIVELVVLHQKNSSSRGKSRAVRLRCVVKKEDSRSASLGKE